jgi:hypothetical protein
MKRIIVLTAAGALLALQGCAVEDTDIETGSVGQRVECSSTDGGINKTKAALAVAMAEELGELDPLRQLEVRDGKVALKAGVCPGSCPKTLALLDFQDDVWMQVIPQGTFNATSYREDLKASLGRQADWENNLNLNNPSVLPGAHSLSLASSQPGVCGVDFTFDVSDKSGTQCAPTTSTTEAIYEIKGVQSGRCLDIAWGSSDNGANLQIYDCVKGGGQKFMLQDLGNGYKLIKNAQSGKCLDVVNWSSDNGANVQQYDCHGGNNQQFQVLTDSSGKTHFINRQSGKSLDIANWGTANGSNVHQWAYGGGSNQQYYLNVITPASTTTTTTCTGDTYSGVTDYLKNRLIFFGGDQNPYLAFRSTDTTISIDPDTGDTGLVSTGDGALVCDYTSLCRVWDSARQRSGCCECPGVTSGTWTRYARNPNYALCVQ